MFRIVASQSIPSWNQIIAWLKEMEALRQIVQLLVRSGHVLA